MFRSRLRCAVPCRWDDELKLVLGLKETTDRCASTVKFLTPPKSREISDKSAETRGFRSNSLVEIVRLAHATVGTYAFVLVGSA